MTTFERIEELRKKKGISQGALEKELGISNGSISKWRYHEPTAERLQKVANYFGVTMEYLKDGKEDENTYYLNEETAKTAQEIYDNDNILFEAYRSSSKDRLVAYAKKLEELRKMEEGE